MMQRIVRKAIKCKLQNYYQTYRITANHKSLCHNHNAIKLSDVVKWQIKTISVKIM